MPYKPDLSSHQVNSLIELPKFSPVAEGIPGEDAVAAYERDGVVCLQGAFSKFWVDMVSKGMTKALKEKIKISEELQKASALLNKSGRS